MANLEQIINSTAQLTSEYWARGDRLLDVRDAVSVVKTPSGDRYATTPGAVPLQTAGVFSDEAAEDLSDAEKHIYSKRYSIARTLDSGGHPQGPLHLIVNDNYTNPLLRLDAVNNGLMVIDDSLTTVEDSSKYLEPIIKSLEVVVSGVAAEKRRNRNAEFNQRMELAGKFGKVALGLCAASAALYGVYRLGAFVAHADHSYHVHKAAAEQSQRVKFDAKGVAFKATPLTAGTLSYVQSNPVFFQTNFPPKPAKNDGFSHARNFAVEESCLKLATIDAPSQAAQLITDAAPESVTSMVTNGGDVYVCNPQYNQNGLVVNVALEVVPQGSQGKP